MNRRRFLKAALGIGPALILGRKVLADSPAEVFDKCAQRHGYWWGLEEGSEGAYTLQIDVSRMHTGGHVFWRVVDSEGKALDIEEAHDGEL